MHLHCAMCVFVCTYGQHSTRRAHPTIYNMPRIEQPQSASPFSRSENAHINAGGDASMFHFRAASHYLDDATLLTTYTIVWYSGRTTPWAAHSAIVYHLIYYKCINAVPSSHWSITASLCVIEVILYAHQCGALGFRAKRRSEWIIVDEYPFELPIDIYIHIINKSCWGV